MTFKPSWDMRARYYVRDHNWPRSIDLWLAAYGNYKVPRMFWNWPRRHALMNALALRCGRAYRRGPKGLM